MDGLLENGCFKFNRWLSNTTFVESYNQTVRGICSIVRFIRSKDIYIYVCMCVCIYIYIHTLSTSRHVSKPGTNVNNRR